MLTEPKLADPGNLTQSELTEFKTLVMQGGEVNSETLSFLVDNAVVLARVFSGDQLVAVGGLKRPNHGYRQRVFEKAGVDLGEAFLFELGWVFADKTFRGNGAGKSITKSLVEYVDRASIYATCREDNSAMQRILEAEGFEWAGSAYSSERHDKKILLFTISAPSQA